VGLRAPTARPNDYIRSAAKIEARAKSALDPHALPTVRPYVADDLPRLDLAVSNVVTVEAERTFWDKIMILHVVCAIPAHSPAQVHRRDLLGV